jgi:hypothetical protein
MTIRRHAIVLATMAVATSGLLLFMVALGGLVLLLSLAAAAAIIVALPVLWMTGKRRSARRLLMASAMYAAVYLLLATGITLAAAGREPNLAVGQEVCADSGCFAVERVETATAAQATSYTLHWHLASNDKQLSKHFPGKGLELYLFDERGRTFRLPADANPNPLDVLVPAGQTVRQTMTFTVPADARQLFLSAKYRPFTFQSLLPGELSLVPHRPGRMIRIQ